MPRLYLTREQRSQLTAKYKLSPSTLHEIVCFLRPDCQRHAEIANYAVNELGARIFDV